MTSEKNNDETVAFWKEKNYFGYPAQYVRFFKQDMAPAVDFSGKVILEGKANIALSPNGNGGWYSSLARCGLLSEIRARGIEWLNAFAVDNVLQRIADPVFVGACIAEGVNCGSKVVCKAEPHEKVGVLCLEDGKPNIIEYYELTEEMERAGRKGRFAVYLRCDIELFVSSGKTGRSGGRKNSRARGEEKGAVSQRGGRTRQAADGKRV